MKSESEHSRNERLLASLNRSLRLTKATNRALLEKANRSMDQLADLMNQHKTSMRDLLTNHLPSHDPNYIPDPKHIEMAEKLDSLISAKKLLPTRPSNLMTRIISQGI